MNFHIKGTRVINEERKLLRGRILLQWNFMNLNHYFTQVSNITEKIILNKCVLLFMLIISVMLIYFIYLIMNESITNGGDIVAVVAIGIAAVVTGIGAFGVDSL